MTDAEILELVRDMRAAQRRWFAERNRVDLDAAKRLEAKVDKALAARFAMQGSLL